jgi:hypothetical protein
MNTSQSQTKLVASEKFVSLSWEGGRREEEIEGGRGRRRGGGRGREREIEG